MTVSIEIDVTQIERSPAIVEWYQRFAAECLREAQKLAVERISGGTGAYERNFRFELLPGQPPKLLFGNASPIAIYVEDDTEPHIIKPTPPGRSSFTNPNKPGALKWFAGAKGGGAGPANLRFATEVHHPGTTGQHIVRDAVREAGRLLDHV